MLFDRIILVMTKLSLLILAGCVEKEMQQAVDQVKDQIEETLTGITGSAIQAAIELKNHDCVLIHVYSYGVKNQQIAISKSKMAQDEVCPMFPIYEDIVVDETLK